MLEFAVTLTVIIFFVAKSFRVSEPFAASIDAIKPARFLKDPLTTSSACTDSPSSDFAPRTRS